MSERAGRPSMKDETAHPDKANAREHGQQERLRPEWPQASPYQGAQQEKIQTAEAGVENDETGQQPMGCVAEHQAAVAEKVEQDRQHRRAAYRQPNRRASQHERCVAEIAERRVESADGEVAQKSHSIAFRWATSFAPLVVAPWARARSRFNSSSRSFAPFNGIAALPES